MILPCPVCSDHIEPIQFCTGINADFPAAEPIKLVRCPDCQTIFVPAGSSQPQSLYSDNYYGENAASSLINRIATAIFQAERRMKTVKRSGEGKVLDIGCGDGTFLLGMPPGWRLFGYDPSPHAQRLLASRGSIRPFDIFNPSGAEKFDLITFWQSLEHISDPVTVLGRARELISDNGTIFISVPNIKSMQARMFKGRWFHLDPARHAVHYSLESLSTLLKRCGLTIEKAETFSLEYGVFGWLQSIQNHMGFEFNYLYKTLKSRSLPDHISRNYRIKAGVMTSAALLLIPSLLLSLSESLFKNGAVLNVSVKKGKK